MNYAIKKHYAIETGFLFTEGDRDYIVVDVITHQFDAGKKLHGALPDPLVVYRPLNFSIDLHERCMMPLSLFAQKYFSQPLTLQS
jgi:hypothetical protein